MDSGFNNIQNSNINPAELSKEEYNYILNNFLDYMWEQLLKL